MRGIIYITILQRSDTCYVLELLELPETLEPLESLRLGLVRPR